MDRPLSHIRVLDLTRVLAGPWAAQNLADLGAEVIKIERPERRRHAQLGSAVAEGRDGHDTREAAYFLSVNRGKKSVTVDIAKPAGQQIVRELAAKSDVLIENYKVGDLARYGLGYDELRRRTRARLLLDHRIRPGRPVRAAPGLRLRLPGDGRADEHHRRARRAPGGGPQKVGIAVTDI